jgi:hypothetical protein
MTMKGGTLLRREGVHPAIAGLNVASVCMIDRPTPLCCRILRIFDQ